MMMTALADEPRVCRAAKAALRHRQRHARLRRPSLPVAPRRTDVPTLVLAGQFDPNARPAASQHVAVLIGRHARWLEFLGMGHSVRAFSPCAARITAEFFQRPDQAVATSCASELPPVHFVARHESG